MKTINFSDWYILKNRIPDKCFSYESGENYINVNLSGLKYTAVEFARKSSDILGSSMYKINFDKAVDNVTAKIIYAWIDESDKILVKGYADNDEIISSPINAAKLELAVLVCSFEKGSCSISNIKVEYQGEYKSKNVKLATIALDYSSQPLPVTKEYNLNSSLQKIDEVCINENPDLIVLTETFYTRKTMLPTKKCSLPENSEPIMLMREKAKKYKTFIAFSFNEYDNGEYFNTGFLIDRNGEIAGKYHKTHLTMAELEAEMTPGRDIKVFDTEIGRIAIPICWDLFFPGYAMQITKQKVDIICHPTAGYKDSRMSQRAKECGAYLIVSTVHDYDASAIYAPDGTRIADASEHNGYGVAEIDLNKPVYTYWQSYPANTDGTNIYRNESRWDLY